MDRIKSFTQSITGILMGLMGFVFFWVFTRLLWLTGIIQWVDGFYLSNNLLFWLGIVITRLLYGLFSIWALVRLIEILEDREFFWSIQRDVEGYREQSRKRAAKVDKSGEIRSWTFAAIIITVAGEIVIRVFTGFPPYLS